MEPQNTQNTQMAVVAWLGLQIIQALRAVSLVRTQPMIRLDRGLAPLPSVSICVICVLCGSNSLFTAGTSLPIR